MNRINNLVVSVLLMFTGISYGARDLTGWYGVDRFSRWMFSYPDTESVRMDENASSTTVAPSWIVSDFILEPNSSVSITLELMGTSDNDFVGLVFGYQDSDHFYLLDWKKGAQSWNWGDPVLLNDDYAEMGLKVKKVDGSWTRDGLWGGTDGIGVTTIAGPTGGGWSFKTAYVFDFEFMPGRIIIRKDGELLFDISEPSFTGAGRIGGYGFSQGELVFSNVTVSPEPLACMVNLEDFARLAGYWLVSRSYLPADLDKNGAVDITDLEDMVANWLEPCPSGWQLK